MNGLKLFVCTNHKDGAVSVTLAHTEHEAARLLKNAIEAQGLPSHPFTFQQLDTTAPRAYLLRNGDC